MKFGQIVGHSEKKNTLIQSIQKGRIPHAQLFIGDSGWGTFALALAYAQFVACLDRNDEDSCGKCASCMKFQALTHPDVHFTFPFPKEQGDLCRDVLAKWRSFVLNTEAGNLADWMQFLGSEKKQANIPVAELRDILKTLSFKPFESEFKFVFIWLPEFLGKEGNILLKAIEEPSSNTLFMLVTENPEKILGTIISRTQSIRIAPIETAALAAYFQNSKELDPEKSHQLAHISQGNLRTAVHLYAESENPYFEMLRTWMGFCVTRKMTQIVTWADKVGTMSRESLKGFFLYSLAILRGVLVSSYDPSLNYWMGREADFIQKFQSLKIPLEQLERIIVEIELAMNYIERNARASLVLTDLSYTLVRNLKN
jgi:DNA polymerase-3 subunit delta'